jgi:glycerol kinase
MSDEKKTAIDFLNQQALAERSAERANNMNTIPTIGLPMWRVSMIAWKRRSGKRLHRLISRAHRLSLRLFISQRLQGRC